MSVELDLLAEVYRRGAAATMGPWTVRSGTTPKTTTVGP
jgi:hypothetical protein